MKTTHLEQKRKQLLDRREKLIGRFNEAARSRKSTSRLSAEIRRTNEFLGSLEQIVTEYSEPARGHAVTPSARCSCKTASRN
jgi:hypothetical protein